MKTAHCFSLAISGAVLLLLVLLPASGSRAHPFGGVFQNTYIYPMLSFVTIEYETHIGRDVLLTLQPDTNHDQTLSEDEQNAFLERLARTLIPKLTASIDHTPLDLAEMGRALELENPDQFLDGINTFFTLRAPLPVHVSAGKVFRFYDHNFLDEEMDRLNYFHGILGQSSGTKLLEKGRGVELHLETGNESRIAGAGKAKDKDRDDLMSRYFTGHQHGLRMFLFAAAGAFVLGAAHALSPGHGKAMVAAYLVGTRGSVTHAFLLGIIVTLTHVSSVVLLGIAAVFLSKYVMPRELLPWLERLSGSMIFLIGYWMLARRALQKAGHHHSHHHGETETAPITPGSLLAMGFAGGIVPCPSALVVLLLSLSFSRGVEGLVLIFFFSLGLAAVLTLVGILIVKASNVADRLSETRAWVRRLPVFSAGIIMIIGSAIVARSFL